MVKLIGLVDKHLLVLLLDVIRDEVHEPLVRGRAYASSLQAGHGLHRPLLDAFVCVHWGGVADQKAEVMLVDTALQCVHELEAFSRSGVPLDSSSR